MPSKLPSSTQKLRPADQDLSIIQDNLAIPLDKVLAFANGLLNGTTAEALSIASLAVSGAITTATLAATGALTAATLATTGAITGATATLTGALTAASAAITGAITAASVTTTGAITASGLLTVNNQATTRGIKYTQGIGATTLNASFFNLWWTGSAAQLWVDTTNVGTINTTSDRRLKQGVQTITESIMPLLMLVRPVRYKWRNVGIFRDDGTQHLGFIADELKGIATSLVNGNPGELNPDGSIAPQTLNIMEILPLLVKGMQELQTQITALKPPGGP